MKQEEGDFMKLTEARPGQRKKKDRIFIIVLAIVVANLFYTLIQIVPYLITVNPRDFQGWALAASDVIGIIGSLWLIRAYRRSRRNEEILK